MQDNQSLFRTRKRILNITHKQQMVLKFIRDRGTSGATDKQIQAGLSMHGDTQRPRRRELEKAGLIREAGHNRNGCKVWIAVDSDGARSAVASQPAVPINSATTIGPMRQRQIESARRTAEELEAAFGGRLDDMSPDEVSDVIEMLDDDVARDGLHKRFGRLGPKSGFVRPSLLRLLQQSVAMSGFNGVVTELVQCWPWNPSGVTDRDCWKLAVADHCIDRRSANHQKS